MTSTVSVLTPTGRRQMVKVTSGTSILQILEDVCKKQGCDPAEFDLRHHKTLLDLSNTVRFSNIPNNAQLEMVKATKARLESTVIIGLQLPTNERVLHTFGTRETVWDVLVRVQVDRNEILTESKDAEGNVLEPVCVYMRREVVGVSQLKSTTLRSLGLTGGKAVLRLFYRSADKLVEQPHVESIVLPKFNSDLKRGSDAMSNEMEISDHVASDLCDTSASASSSGATSAWPSVDSWGTRDEDARENWDSSEQSAYKQLEKHTACATSSDAAAVSGWGTRDGVDSDNHRLSEWPETKTFAATEKPPNITEKCALLNASSLPSESQSVEPMDASHLVTLDSAEGNLIYLDDRGSLLYCLDEVNAPVNVDLPDSYFEVTLADIKILFCDLKQKREEMENGLLRTQGMRDSESLFRLNRYPKAVIRVVFPDRLVLQGQFKAINTVNEIIKFVRSFLADDQCDFSLFTAPPKRILDPEDRLFEIPLVPAAIVYFGCETKQGPYLKDCVLQRISSPQAVNLDTSLLRATSKSKCQNVGFGSDGQASTSNRIDSNFSSMASSLESTSSISGHSSSSKDVPKWFSVGKKF